MTPSIDHDYAECERVLAKSGSTFALPIRLLPRPKRRATAALYAFCRLADDAADAAVGRSGESRGAEHDPRTALARMRVDLTEALVGGGDEPVIRALADATRRFGIPRDVLFDVLDGVEMDLEPLAFGTFDDLEEYCRRVASSVGIAAIHIWGFHSEKALRPAHACGVAFQLTNILRDVREDAGAGRVYLPDRDLAECGMCRSDVLAASTHPGLVCVLRRLACRAQAFYAEASRLDPLLSCDGRIAFRGMLGAYAAIFRRVSRKVHMQALFSGRIPKRVIVASAIATIVCGPGRLAAARSVER